MVDLDSLLMQVDQSTSELLGLHKELVKIESVNTGQMPTGNESNVADLAKQWLSNEGIESEVVESAPGRGNLIANMPGKSEKNKLLLVSHLDVVPVEDAGKWNYSPFGSELDNGRVYGRGTYDCKGANSSLSSKADTLRVVVRALTSCDDIYARSGFNNGEYLTCSRVDCTYNKLASGAIKHPT